MNLYVVMILGCIGGGIYAIAKRTLPIGPRRKVIDGPAVRLGAVLIALPFANAILFGVARWIAATQFPDSRSIEHWSVMAPIILFPLSIAGCLTVAKRWSVPKHYHGDWLTYVPYQRKEFKPDFSMFDSPDSEVRNDG